MTLSPSVSARSLKLIVYFSFQVSPSPFVKSVRYTYPAIDGTFAAWPFLRYLIALENVMPLSPFACPLIYYHFRKEMGRGESLVSLCRENGIEVIVTGFQGRGGARTQTVYIIHGCLSLGSKENRYRQ